MLPILAPHPAVYSDPLLPVMVGLLDGHKRIHDPFAGTGKIFQLEPHLPGAVITASELQPRWAAHHPKTEIGDATDLPYPDNAFDAICTSPVYPNRMTDHHNAQDGSHRITYTHYYGEPLHPNNAGSMPWGDKWRGLHKTAFTEFARMLVPGGAVVLNVKDFIKTVPHSRANAPYFKPFGVGEKNTTVRVQVTDWCIDTLNDLGFSVEAHEQIECPGMRKGQNGNTRISYESVIKFRYGDPRKEYHFSMSRNYEWGTPGLIVDMARQVLGEIDLDPASAALWNMGTVRAKTFWGLFDWGLRRDWWKEDVIQGRELWGVENAAGAENHSLSMRDFFTSNMASIKGFVLAAETDRRPGAVLDVDKWVSGIEAEDAKIVLVPMQSLFQLKKNAPDAERQSPPTLRILAEMPNATMDSIAGAKSVTEMYQESECECGALIPSNQLRLRRIKDDTTELSWGDHKSENHLGYQMQNGDSGIGNCPLIGVLINGRDAKVIGVIDALIVENLENLHRIILFPWIPQDAPEPCRATCYPLANLVTTLSKTKNRINGSCILIKIEEFSIGILSDRPSARYMNISPSLTVRTPSTVFINPPFGRYRSQSNLKLWTEKLIEEYDAGRIQAAICVTTDSMSDGFMHEIKRRFPICLPDGRISFVGEDGKPIAGNTKGTAIVYLGPDEAAFVSVFGRLGAVMKAIH